MTSKYSHWRTSSYTEAGASCVEVAQAADGTIGVRDTKQHGTGPVLEFTRTEWADLLTRVRHNEHP